MIVKFNNKFHVLKKKGYMVPGEKKILVWPYIFIYYKHNLKLLTQSLLCKHQNPKYLSDMMNSKIYTNSDALRVGI